jgi:2-methylcitrate dehydratase PrpD
MKPLWINRDVQHVTQAQFSMAHGLAVGAHRIPVGKAWQSPDVVFDPSVIALMDKVEYVVHPEYAGSVASNAGARPARIEVRARGRAFGGEAGFPKGSPSPDPATTMTDDEISAKFVRNAEGVLETSSIDAALNRLWNVDRAESFRDLMPMLAGKY